MSDDLESIEITLASGHVFTINGPQGIYNIYYGTVGDSPEFSNAILGRYAQQFHDDGIRGENEIEIDSDHVTIMACSSSPWALLQFPDSRRNEVVANLELLLLEAT